MGTAAAAERPVDDLERHYFQLHEQRRKTEELLRETERIMLDVKRGLDELHGVINGEDGAASTNGNGAGLRWCR
jgi:hypothetical protein